MNSDKLVQIGLPIVLAALLATIGFLVVQIMLLKDTVAVQIMSLKDTVAEFKLSEAQHYSELDKKLAVYNVNLENLANQIDRMVK